MTEEEKQALRSSAKSASFADAIGSYGEGARAFTPIIHTPTGTPLELAPRREFESTDNIPYHVMRTKAVSVVMLKSGRYGVARVRFATDPPTRNAQGEPPSSGGTSNLSSGYVHVGAPHATRGEAEKAAYALAHQLGLAADGWA